MKRLKRLNHMKKFSIYSEQLKTIKGMEQKTAERFVKNIPKFMDFIQTAKLEEKLKDIPLEEPKDENDLIAKKFIEKINDNSVT